MRKTAQYNEWINEEIAKTFLYDLDIVTVETDPHSQFDFTLLHIKSKKIICYVEVKGSKLKSKGILNSFKVKRERYSNEKYPVLIIYINDIEKSGLFEILMNGALNTELIRLNKENLNREISNLGVQNKKSLTTSQNATVPIKSLPLFKHIDKADQWYGLLPEITDIIYKWIIEQQQKLSLPLNYRPYYDYTLHLWKTSVIVAGNGEQYFAAQSLPSIIERIGLLWTSLPNSHINPKSILNKFESNDQKIRVSATKAILDFAEKQDSEFKLLYLMLSRYFGHISNLDLIRINQEIPKDKLLATRLQVIPILLIIDTGICFVRCISSILNSQGKTVPELTGGRKGLFSFSIKKYLRLSQYIMCDKHTRTFAIKFGVLFKGVKDISGEIGITDIYRGGMELFRYGNHTKKPTIKQISGFAIFALGRHFDDQIKVNIISQTDKGEHYQFSWPKWLEIDATVVSQIAAQKRKDDFLMFDYVEQFINVVDETEKLKLRKKKDDL